MIKKPKFDAETVISDFLGDMCDGHPRVGRLNSTDYKRLREQAQVLIADLAENGIAVSSPDREGK
jgi:hypothetical protein